MKRPRLPTYTYTNESLAGIVAGLDPQPEDRILTICGSGDQPFALAEYAGSVLVVDRDAQQLAYARWRKEKLQQSEVQDFLYSNVPVSAGPCWRNDYFQQGKRLARIRKKLEAVDFSKGDIYNIMEKEGGRFNKVYLSNASPCYQEDDIPSFYYQEDKISSLVNLSRGTLIYLIPTGKFSLIFNSASQWSASGKPIKPVIKVVNHLTKRARKTSPEAEIDWEPLIFKRV